MRPSVWCLGLVALCGVAGQTDTCDAGACDNDGAAAPAAPKLLADVCVRGVEIAPPGSKARLLRGAGFVEAGALEGFAWWRRRPDVAGGAAALRVTIVGPRDGEVFAFSDDGGGAGGGATIRVRVRAPPRDALALLPSPTLQLAADRTTRGPSSHLITASLAFGAGALRRVVADAETSTMIDVVPGALLEPPPSLAPSSLGCARARAAPTAARAPVAEAPNLDLKRRKLRVAFADLTPPASVDGQRRVWLQRCGHWNRMAERPFDLTSDAARGGPAVVARRGGAVAARTRADRLKADQALSAADWADALIVPSHFAARATLKSLAETALETPVVVLQPGVDDEWFRAGAKRRDDPKPGRTAVWVGRLDADKSPLLFVRACALAAQKDAATRCLIVGDGPLQAALAARASALAPGLRNVANGTTQFLGSAADDGDLSATVAAADVLVSTSVFPETFGLAPLKARPRGCPSSRLASRAWRSVCDGVTAVVPRATPDALAKAMTGLLDDAGRARARRNGAAAATHFGPRARRRAPRSSSAARSTPSPDVEYLD
ncbi:glycosyl transferase [Aureococcus anophagefferens]|nr:glycosyl transferase [Aureococcus anophagefferens]